MDYHQSKGIQTTVSMAILTQPVVEGILKNLAKVKVLCFVKRYSVSRVKVSVINTTQNMSKT